MISLKGKNALVTGASRGIGLTIAQKFLSLGANVFINDLDAASLEETKNQLSNNKNQLSNAGQVYALAGDVSKEEDVAAMEKAATQQMGNLHILVNNAGITRDGLLMRMNVSDWEAVMNVNLKSIFLMCKAFSRSMIKNREGSIINIASIVGQIGNAGQTNYAASKGGAIAFSKSLAREVAARGVTVNAVAPGFIETEMTKKLSEDVRSNLLQSIPMRTLGSSNDVAAAVAFLASDAARYITGAVIPVNGGMAMQ